MQVSTGNLYPTRIDALNAGVPAHDLVMIEGTREQVEAVSRAVGRANANSAKKAARRAAQRSRRANR